VLTFLSYIGLYQEQASWQSTKEIDEIHRTIHIVTATVCLSRWTGLARPWWPL